MPCQGMANVSDPFTWHEDANNPILTSAPEIRLDDPAFSRVDSVIYHAERDEYWIFYTGYSASTRSEAIGLATCPAGKDGYSGVVKAISSDTRQSDLVLQRARPG